MSAHSMENTSAGVRGRKLPQYLAVYGGACAGFLQLFDIATQRLGIADRYFTVVLIICALGLPLVIGAALVRELASRDQRPRHEVRGHHVLGGVAVLLFIVFAAVAVPRAAAHYAPQRSGDASAATVLLTSFSTRTGDSALAAVASDALQLDFAQDPSLRVLPRQRLAHLLALDGVVLDGSITPAVARRYAARVGAVGIVEGELARSGRSYLLLARLLTASGEQRAGVRLSTADETGLWSALDDASKQLRAAARALPPQEALSAGDDGTVAAPDALVTYARAVQAMRAGDRSSAEELLRRVLRAETQFLPALRTLGDLLYARGDSAAGRPVLVRAHDAAASVTGRERYLALAAYYQHVAQDTPRATVSYRRVLELDPADSLALARIATLKPGQ